MMAIVHAISVMAVAEVVAPGLTEHSLRYRPRAASVEEEVIARLYV